MANAEKVAEGLTAKQLAFVEAYVSNRFRATDAAITAGYPEKGAREISWENLQKPHIQEAIQRRVKDRAKALGYDASRERIVAELCAIAFSDPEDMIRVLGDVQTIRQLPSHHRAAIAEVSETTTEHGGTVRVKFHSKTQALDMLAKILGVYAPEKLEATIKQDDSLNDRLRNTTREEQDILSRVLFPGRDGEPTN